MKPKLKAVPACEPDPPTDVTMLLRAEIERRDWSRVHIAGDSAKPLFLADRVRRPWLR